MGTFIHLNESKLMDYYEKMMDEVFLQYHTHPSEIPAWANCDHGEALNQRAYESEALYHARKAGADVGDSHVADKPRINHHGFGRSRS